MFIGPSPEVMRRLGDKIAAKRLAEEVGVPLAAWSGGPVADVEAAPGPHADDRLPADGQGKCGRRRARHPAGQLTRASSTRHSSGRARRRGRRPGTPRCSSSGRSAAGGTSRCRSSPTPTARYGRSGVRDCSVQRRNQKVIEESASTALDAEQEELLRAQRGRARPAGGLHQRRHGRVPLRARGAAAVVPRGQHAAAGGAPGDRGDHGRSTSSSCSCTSPRAGGWPRSRRRPPPERAGTRSRPG